MFAFAGLYDVRQDAEGQELKTYTILTTEPNELMVPIHKRMPVILPREKEDAWLSSVQDVRKLQKLLVPYDASNMDAYPVLTKVNKPSFDHPEAVKRQEGSKGGQYALA
jgi:putative SOS response-associated peptidase YedK